MKVEKADAFRLHPSSFIHHPSRSKAFTLIEMLTTIAVLVIVLGLMVSLARYVRDRSAQQLTRDLLRQLDALMLQYTTRNGGQTPTVPPLLGAVPATRPIEAILVSRAALRNNERVIGSLVAGMRPEAGPSDSREDPFLQHPSSVYDPKAHTLRDSWGSPIVFMPGQHPLIGLAPSRLGKDQYFFFSAGADRNYLSRDDNLYSYETSAAE